MDQQAIEAIARILTKALVDLALIVVPILAGYAANALRRLAADRRVSSVLTTHRLLDAIARQAVMAVEQIMTSEAGPEKKQAALSRALVELGGHGVPLTTATLAVLDDAIEAQVLLARTVGGVERRRADPPGTGAPTNTPPAGASG